MKAKGYIKDYGIEVVEQLDGMPKVVVTFDFTERDADIKYTTMKWDGFFTKRDGTVNKNTIKTLIAMGFRGEDPIVLAEGEGLDTAHEYFITVEIDEKGYQRIQWVNREEHTGGAEGIKKASTDSLKRKFAEMRIGGDIKKLMSETAGPKKEAIPNKAPEFNSSEKIPF